MERKTIAKWLIVAALACFGFVLFSGIALAQDGTTVQGTNSSDTSAAETGDATGNNNSSFTAGPAAQNQGDGGATSQQLGQNAVTLSQSGSAKTGDPVAGGQVTGVVGDNVTVQNQNTAIDPEARSGNASVENDADDIFVGPQAVTDDDTASAQQVGNNSFDVTQDAQGSTGDAVGGSQVTGIVGDGEHTVQNSNNSDCTAPAAGGNQCARSGDADLIDNDVDDTVIGPNAVSDDDDANASQVGDNDAVISQSASGVTGDALHGSQVTGVVGGSATVQGSNTSDCNTGDDCAESGETEVINEIEDLIIGTAATADDTTSAQQTGDNTADVTQEVSAHSGDALSGSQVVGGVGDEGGFLTVQNQQASEDDQAESGESEVQNELDDVNVGVLSATDGDDDASAQQNGGNDLAVVQDADATTGDALAGSQVTGGVGYSEITVQNSNTSEGSEAETGDVESADVDGDPVNDIDETFVGPQAVVTDDDGNTNVSQLGDNSASTEQTIAASTGDAVAGGQVTGAVASGSEITVQNSNVATDANADSGDIDNADNNLVIRVGPLADTDNDGNASAQQSGDNILDATQAVVAASGDAVAAAQVTGAVSGDNSTITVQNSNSCLNNNGTDCGNADTGEVEAENDIGSSVGPQAESDDDNASAQQLGDNSASVDQALEGTSGDAVAGSQVTGAVAGDGSTVEVQEQNTAESAEAESGDVDLENELTINVGPEVEAEDNASAQQVGDDTLAFTQDATATSGDAVGGSQVTGIVGTDDTTVQVANSDDSSEAESGDVQAENEAQGNVAPNAESDDGVPTVSFSGDSDIDGSQDQSTESGDAVAGSQINGGVGASQTSSALSEGVFGVASAA